VQAGTRAFTVAKDLSAGCVGVVVRTRRASALRLARFLSLRGRMTPKAGGVGSLANRKPTAIRAQLSPLLPPPSVVRLATERLVVP
jgi:hypothetical protein